MSDVYAATQKVENPDDCYFYHVMDIPGFGNTLGATNIDGAQWDLRGRFQEYSGIDDFTGKRVFDVGCASGFLSFEMERLGAEEVVSFDAKDGTSIDWLKMPGIEYTDNYDEWLKGSTAWLKRVQSAYWYTHERLNSKTKVHYGDVYDLPEDLGKFDVCLIAQLIVHLRDPIAALESVAAHCSGSIVIAETMVDTKEPIARFGYADNRNPWKWWTLSPACYGEILKVLGFEVVSVNTASYKVHLANGKSEEWPITTLRADRVR